jgi:hypothetical protein
MRYSAIFVRATRGKSEKTEGRRGKKERERETHQDSRIYGLDMSGKRGEKNRKIEEQNKSRQKEEKKERRG